MIHTHTSPRRPAGRIYATLGSPQNAEFAVSVAGSAGAIAATAAVQSVASAGGFILGISASSLVPVVGPAIGLAVFAIQHFIANSGCGPTCVITSEWANQAAAALTQNLRAYFSQPTPRKRSSQVVCVAAFATVWQHLVQQCGQEGTGNAGKRCVSDRQAGACTWRQDQPPGFPGQPNIGECVDWFNLFRDPIANDPDVYDDTDGGLLPAGIPTVAGIPAAVWLPLVAIALGVALL